MTLVNGYNYVNKILSVYEYNFFLYYNKIIKGMCWLNVY